jgi:hypothetical protein
MLQATESDGGIVGPIFYRTFLSFFSWWVNLYTLVAIGMGNVWFAYTQHAVQAKKMT